MTDRSSCFWRLVSVSREWEIRWFLIHIRINPPVAHPGIYSSLSVLLDSCVPNFPSQRCPLFAKNHSPPCDNSVAWAMHLYSLFLTTSVHGLCLAENSCRIREVLAFPTDQQLLLMEAKQSQSNQTSTQFTSLPDAPSGVNLHLHFSSLETVFLLRCSHGVLVQYSGKRKFESQPIHLSLDCIAIRVQKTN